MKITNSQLSAIAGSGRGQKLINEWIDSWLIWRQNELMEHILKTPECPCHDEVLELACNQEIDHLAAIEFWLDDRGIIGDIQCGVNQSPTESDYQCLVLNDGEQVASYDEGDMEVYTGDGIDELSAYKDFCEQNGVMTEDFTRSVEIFEWYAIESYMVSRLEHTVEDVFGMNIWGRTCTGQSICMDWDIQCLWAEMNPEAAIELAKEICNG
jgi:hypothetical protein